MENVEQHTDLASQSAALRVRLRGKSSIDRGNVKPDLCPAQSSANRHTQPCSAYVMCSPSCEILLLSSAR